MIANTGKAAISSIQVQDKLPGQMLYVDKESTLGTTYDEATGRWNIPVLEAGAQATLTLTSVVANIEEDEELVTTAEIISVDGFGPATHPTSFASVRLNAIRYGALTVAKAVQLSGASQEGFPFGRSLPLPDGAACTSPAPMRRTARARPLTRPTPSSLSFALGRQCTSSCPGACTSP